jgi:hypothetical protein
LARGLADKTRWVTDAEITQYLGNALVGLLPSACVRIYFGVALTPPTSIRAKASGGVMKCWICGSPADTREHKFKKSDVMRASARWTPGDQPYFVSDCRIQQIQGPRSKLVTFDKVLCGGCNSAHTQPYDKAYERFSDWVNARGADVMTYDYLDFADIYDVNFQDGVSNLLRYFAKHIGCRVASDGYTVPDLLPAFLNSNARLRSRLRRRSE